MRDILKGAINIHFHTSPDVVNRKVSDYELCERLSKTEMAGCVVKSHTFETAARVENLKKQFPNLELFGGVALNNSMGGLNPYAVEKMAIMGGKIVWFPTFDSLEWRKCNGEINFAEEYITVFDDNGNIKPVVNKILAIALKYDLVVSTGHLCAKEGLALLKLANEMGLKRLLVGHADNPKDEYTIEEQKLAASYGAMIEHSYFTTFFDRVSIEEIARQIRGVGVEHVILSTDFGQVNALECDDGLFEYATKIMEQGFTEEEVRTMIVDNPKKLLK